MLDMEKGTVIFLQVPPPAIHDNTRSPTSDSEANLRVTTLGENANPRASLASSSFSKCIAASHSEAPATINSKRDGNVYIHVEHQSLAAAQRHGAEWSLKASLSVFGAFLALFCTFGQMNSFGTYQTWYKRHQLSHFSPSAISWIGSIQFWVFFFSGGPIGRLFDKFGPRWLMIVGSVVYMVAIMMTSISTAYYQYLLAQGLLFGTAAGLLFYPSLASVSAYFSRNKSTAIGLAAAGSSVGGVIYPIMLERLFSSVGFAWGTRITGIVSGACCVIAVLTVTALPSRTKSCPPCTLKSFTDAPYIFLLIGSSFVALGLFIPFFYIVEYAQHHLPPSPSPSPSASSIAASRQSIFYVLAVLNAGGTLGRIAPAYLSDRLGRFNLLFPSAFFSGLSCLAFWMRIEETTSLGPLMAFAVVYGFFSGAFVSVITPCVAQISEVGMVGSRIGVLYSLISFPSLVGGPLAGVLLVRGQGSYTGMIAFSGSTVLAGSVFILFARLKINPRVFVRV